ncbi:MAG TPA: helix-turn-helix domain-containing protein [Phycisphaerae bacterium]|mgnify:CR=1 FL=1|nr:helix-turn-helix domain-containing protein [Phycisphaerae bacterium]
MVMMAVTKGIAEDRQADHMMVSDGGCRQAGGDGALRQLEPTADAKRALLARGGTGHDLLPRSHPNLPTLMTIHEVADLLRCSTRTIHRLIDRGEIPRPLRFGTLLRWPRTQIEGWLAEGCPRAERELVAV